MVNNEKVDLSPRELDAALAERLFGWTTPAARGRCNVCGWPLTAKSMDGCTTDGCSMRPLPETRADEPAHYSTTGDGMLLVLEAMRARVDEVKWMFRGFLAFRIRHNGHERLEELTPRDVALAAFAALKKEE